MLQDDILNSIQILFFFRNLFDIMKVQYLYLAMCKKKFFKCCGIHICALDDGTLIG